MILGVGAAVCAAVCYNVGLLVEKRALGALPPLRLGAPVALFRSLFGRPAWLAGFTLVLAGLVLQVVSQGLLPITVAQPLLAVGPAVLVAASALAYREAPARADLAMLGLLGSSTVLLVLSYDPRLDPVGRGEHPLAVLTVCALAAAGAGAVLGPVRPVFPGPRRLAPRLAAWSGAAEYTPYRAAPPLGEALPAFGRGDPVLRTPRAHVAEPPVAQPGRPAGRALLPRGPRSGTAYGVAVGLLNGAGGLLAKALAVAARDGRRSLPGLAELPYPWLLGLFSVLMLGVMQIGLQRSRAATLVPAQVITGNALVMVAGGVIFHEPLPADPLRLGLRLGALVVSLLVLALRPPGTPAGSGPPAPAGTAGSARGGAAPVQGLVHDGGEALDGGVPAQSERAPAGRGAHRVPPHGVEGDSGPG